MSFKNHRIYTVPGFPFEINKDSPQAQGLHAWWPAVHFSPTKLYDMTTRGKYHMAIRNGPIWKGAPNGSIGLFCNNSGDCYVADADANPSEFTWVIWCSPINDSFAHGLCMGSVNDSPGTGWSHGIYTFPGGNYAGYTYPSPGLGAGLASNTARPSNIPVCIVSRFNANEIAMFVDGMKMNSAAGFTPFNGLNGWHLSTATGFIPFAIPTGFNGWIYDARLYYRSLTDGEIAAIYNHNTRYELYWQPGRRTHFLAPPIVTNKSQVIWFM